MPKSQGQPTLPLGLPEKKVEAPKRPSCECKTANPYIEDDFDCVRDAEQILSDAFITTFTNTRDPKKIPTQRRKLGATVLDMCAQRVPAWMVWAAFSKAHALGNHAPLWTLTTVWSALRELRVLNAGQEPEPPDHYRYEATHVAPEMIPPCQRFTDDGQKAPSYRPPLRCPHCSPNAAIPNRKGPWPL